MALWTVLKSRDDEQKEGKHLEFYGAEDRGKKSTDFLLTDFYLENTVYSRDRKKGVKWMTCKVQWIYSTVNAMITCTDKSGVCTKRINP